MRKYFFGLMEVWLILFNAQKITPRKLVFNKLENSHRRTKKKIERNEMTRTNTHIQIKINKTVNYLTTSWTTCQQEKNPNNFQLKDYQSFDACVNHIKNIPDKCYVVSI